MFPNAYFLSQYFATQYFLEAQLQPQAAPARWMYPKQYFANQYFPYRYFPKPGPAVAAHGHVTVGGKLHRRMIQALIASEMQRSVLDRNSRKLVQRLNVAQWETNRVRRQKEELEVVTEQVMDLTRQAIFLAEI